MDRFLTRESGHQVRHSFSFGSFYDPDRVAFGPLVALNDDLLGTGSGYAAHDHADVVLVTWVVLGSLEHTDGSGTSLQPAGTLSVTHAGSGLTHSETAAEATRFIQMWLRPDRDGGDPHREVTTPDLSTGGLVVAAGAEELRIAGAALSLADLAAGETATLPDATLVYAFVVTGALTRSSLAEPLTAGDAFEIRREDGSEGEIAVTAAVPTQLLVWWFEVREPAPRG